MTLINFQKLFKFCKQVKVTYTNNIKHIAYSSCHDLSQVMIYISFYSQIYSILSTMIFSPILILLSLVIQEYPHYNFLSYIQIYYLSRLLILVFIQFLNHFTPMDALNILKLTFFPLLIYELGVLSNQSKQGLILRIVAH